jgi:tight adherence protein C
MGRNDPSAVDRFLALRAATVVGAFLVFVFVFVVNVTPFTGKMQFAVGGLLMAVLLIGPDSVINRKVEERQHQIQRSLPDVLDLLTISVEAGLGFEQALDRVIHAVPGPLSDEFSRMLGETRAGAARADAMRAMDERCNTPELRSFVLAIIQADTFGVSIGRVLRAQAEEMRIKRRQLAQERAQKAPVKMLLPMVFCIFPALFLVILGPAMLSITKSL